jgi:hypothetical protein
VKWDSKAYWLKAKTYIDRANQHRHDSPDFPLWSALALELLARAALTKIHPVLNADPREDLNLLYACGYEITQQPKSLPLHAVLLRLEKTVPGFGKVQRELCDYVALLRNDELHGTELPFAGLKESKWLPRYYEVCKVLCTFMEKSLPDLLGKEVAKSAEVLVKALDKELEAAVKSKVAAHKKVFTGKSAAEQKKLREQSEASAARYSMGTFSSHECPACGGKGMLGGVLIKELKPVYEGEMMSVDRELLAVVFKCFSCGLDLNSPDEIAHTSIEPRFTARTSTSLHEIFDPEEIDPYMNM